MQAWIASIMNQFGYLGVLFLITIENLFPPIPSEIILTFGGFSTTLTGDSITITGVVIAATIGSVIGAVILYWVGTLMSIDKLKVWLDDKRVKRLGFHKSEVLKTMSFFETYNTPSILIGRCIPIVRSLISIPAGITKMNLPKFIIFSAVGSLIWNVVLVNLGAAAGQNWPTIVHYIDLYQNLIVILIAIIVFAFLIRKFYRPRPKT